MSEPEGRAEGEERGAAAYSASAAAWQAGPGPIYDELSEHLVARSPVGLTGRRVLDLGAGTGAATRALLRRGAHPLALDAAEGMLRVGSVERAPAAVADLLALPVRTGSVDGAVAAYSLNHVVDPVTALREAARVTSPGGPILAAVYAADDGHPVKGAVERAATEAGYVVPAWNQQMRDEIAPLLATVERVEAVLGAAGLVGHATHDRIAFPALGPLDLVAWRLGMAQLAPFVATLDAPAQARLTRRAVDLLGSDWPVLVRSVITIVAATT